MLLILDVLSVLIYIPHYRFYLVTNRLQNNAQGLTMSKVKLTAGRIEKFRCEKGKNQSFLWCAEVPGLGVRATLNSDEKRYIFQAKINKQTMRVTIGKVSVWSIPGAQTEARRLQILIDNGKDPRQVKLDEEKATKENAEAERKKDIALGVKKKLEAITVGNAWVEYVNERKPLWSPLHLNDHVRAIQPGGEKRVRSKKPVTEPGILFPFVSIRLIDLNSEIIEAWSKKEAMKRPTRARLALRLLKAFLNWCAEHTTYKAIVKENPAKNKKAQEYLGKPCVKNDVIQREQLPAWFTAVKQISNSIISAYLQALLLTGARREELATLRWDNIDFKWNSITLRDKVEGTRVIPLTPYVAQLLSMLPRRNEWVFSSVTSASGRLADPRIAHNKACIIAGLDLTLHGLRRSFASLCEWIETPVGIAAQIQGHKPQGVREKNYIRRPLDLLRVWHVKIETWFLEQSEIDFIPEKYGLKLVKLA